MQRDRYPGAAGTNVGGTDDVHVDDVMDESSESEEPDPPLPGNYPLTTLQISTLSLKRLDELWRVRENDDELSMSGAWEDEEPLQFRRAVMEMLDPTVAHWVRSVACAEVLMTWLKARQKLAPDMLRKVTTWHLHMEGGPAKQPDANARQGLWNYVCAYIEVPPGNAPDGCEYLAHAVCEAIRSSDKDVSRKYLRKAWVVAQANVLHPPDNWKHHVAPVLDCADGLYVFDPKLSPNAPMPLAAWQAAAKGPGVNAAVFHHTQPWEFLGKPRFGVTAFEPGIWSRIDATLRNRIDECKTG